MNKNIIKTNNISDVLNLVKAVQDAKTLIVFDVDHVLITKEDPVLRDAPSLIKRFLWPLSIKHI